MAEVIDLTCPNCGAKLQTESDAAEAQCAHCGTELMIERRVIPVAPPVAPAVEPDRCPKCGRADRVRKASSVYSEGISRGYYDGYWGHSQTDLSKLLARPGEPSGLYFNPAGGILGCLASIASLAALGALVVLSSAIFFTVYEGDSLAGPVPGNLLRFCFVGPLASGLWWLAIKSRQPYELKKSLKKAKWKKAVDRWERLYYCARDDGVFTPGETPFIPIGNMQEFLYAD